MPTDNNRPATISTTLTIYKDIVVTVSPTHLLRSRVLRNSQNNLYFLYVIIPRKAPINTKINPGIKVPIIHVASQPLFANDRFLSICHHARYYLSSRTYHAAVYSLNLP